jgi:putative addiction module component (TIGR02574 family)
VGEAAKKILEEALALSEDERLDVAAALWASVPREPDPEWEEAWHAEITRRLADPRPGIPWEQVRDELRARLTGK